MFTHFPELLETHNLFVRNRKSNKIRSLGIALLYYGLSCRKAADVLCFPGADNASYEAVREWYHRAKALLRAPQKRHRPLIAIDETKIKVERRWYYSSSGRRSTRRIWERTARRGTHADERGERCPPPVSYGGCSKVHEHAESAGGRRTVVPTGVTHDGRAVGEGDVREAERGRAVVFRL